MATRLPIEPEGTKRAASRAKISAARDWRRFTVGSSPYTSSPTTASDMARRISELGRVTVSLRRSTACRVSRCMSASLNASAAEVACIRYLLSLPTHCHIASDHRPFTQERDEDFIGYRQALRRKPQA